LINDFTLVGTKIHPLPILLKKKTLLPRSNSFHSLNHKTYLSLVALEWPVQTLDPKYCFSRRTHRNLLKSRER